MKFLSKHSETETSEVIGDRHSNWDRRDFLKCVGAWAGTGLVLSMSGGLLSSCKMEDATPGVLSFMQISDTHIGFGKEPNKDVTRTLELAVRRMNELKARPELILHTGDLTHLSKPGEFDTVEQAKAWYQQVRRASARIPARGRQESERRLGQPCFIVSRRFVSAVQRFV